jgi:hypothetical protein
MHLATIGSHVAPSWNLPSQKATCQIPSRRKTVTCVSKKEVHRKNASAAEMTPREGGHMQLYLIVSLFCRNEFLKLVFLLLAHFLELIPLSLREDRFYFFVGSADHFFKGVQFVLA